MICHQTQRFASPRHLSTQKVKQRKKVLLHLNAIFSQELNLENVIPQGWS